MSESAADRERPGWRRTAFSAQPAHGKWAFAARNGRDRRERRSGSHVRWLGSVRL